MRVEVQMPKMGESITEGRILKWLKAPGDSVDRDETILEIATDKVDTEVPAPNAGILVKIMAEEGDTVEVGTPIAVIETDADAAQVEESTPAKADASGADIPEKPVPAEDTGALADSAEPQKDAPRSATNAQPATAPGTVASPATGDNARFYSPLVMRIASAEGISMQELERIEGSGLGGRVTKNDVLAWLRNRPAGGTTTPPTASSPAAPGGPALSAMPAPSAAAGEGYEVIPMDNMHRLMAEHMVKSMQISPHVSVVSEVDMTKIEKFRQKHADAFKKREGFSLTYMPFIAEATVRALKDFPWLNSSVDGEKIILKKMINLGIAVAMDDGGLIVPVVKNADTLNVIGLGRSISDIARRARIRKLQPEEIQDGTFTITNFGIFGNVFGTPIINQPQVAILGMGAVQKKPVVIERDGEDTIAIRSMMLLSMSFDHRIIDGALGGRFVERVKQYLEDFSLESI
ncbi:MAG: 2-oxo acid dehydrogenase subunit E2 [Bacteroidetes bacterium]|nr:2-oxo acid dehydrogenase subunit E2 [Bacteroidota bacterium]